MFNTKETQEEREDRIRQKDIQMKEKQRKEDREYLSEENRKQQKEMAKILATTREEPAQFKRRLNDQDPTVHHYPHLGRKQCARCKEFGHWKDKCPRH